MNYKNCSTNIDYINARKYKNRHKRRNNNEILYYESLLNKCTNTNTNTNYFNVNYFVLDQQNIKLDHINYYYTYDNKIYLYNTFYCNNVKNKNNNFNYVLICYNNNYYISYLS